MSAFGTVWLIIVIPLFAISGWFLVFRTEMLINRARKNALTRSRFIKAFTSYEVVDKPWYPKYLRWAGIFVWLWTLAIAVLVTTGRFR